MSYNKVLASPTTTVQKRINTILHSHSSFQQKLLEITFLLQSSTMSQKDRVTLFQNIKKCSEYQSMSKDQQKVLREMIKHKLAHELTNEATMNSHKTAIFLLNVLGRPEAHSPQTIHTEAKDNYIFVLHQWCELLPTLSCETYRSHITEAVTLFGKETTDESIVVANLPLTIGALSKKGVTTDQVSSEFLETIRAMLIRTAHDSHRKECIIHFHAILGVSTEEIPLEKFQKLRFQEMESFLKLPKNTFTESELRHIFDNLNAQPQAFDQNHLRTLRSLAQEKQLNELSLTITASIRRLDEAKQVS